MTWRCGSDDSERTTTGVDSAAPVLTIPRLLQQLPPDTRRGCSQQGSEAAGELADWKSAPAACRGLLWHLDCTLRWSFDRTDRVEVDRE